jgi:hypothetical protein
LYRYATAVFVAGPYAGGVAGGVRIGSLSGGDSLYGQAVRGGGDSSGVATAAALGAARVLGTLGTIAYVAGWLIPAFHYLVPAPRPSPAGLGGFLSWLLAFAGLREAPPAPPLGGFLAALAPGWALGVSSRVGGAGDLMDATRRLLSTSPRMLVDEVRAAAGRAGADAASAWFATADSSCLFGGVGGGGGIWTSSGGGCGGGGGSACAPLSRAASSSSSSGGGWRQLAVAALVLSSLSLWYVRAAVGRRRALAAAVAGLYVC